MKNELCVVEYIWLDGDKPVQKLRSKTKIVPSKGALKLADLPEWSYDGSSTYQASGGDSDLILKPIYMVNDPVRDQDNAYLVMCEVFNPDAKSPHETNTRAELRKIMDAGGAKADPWIGFEQEYVFFDSVRPLGWPEGGYPAPQGPFYCSVGADVNFGRAIAEEHMAACISAGLCFYGINAEVMPGQWEFQIGYRGVDGEAADPLTLSDQMWIARYLLNIIAEKYGVTVKIGSKPVKGDWNGSGMHTNFSTKETRDKVRGMEAINAAIQNLKNHHDEHIKNYGTDLHERLTGLHETCHISEFKAGVADRGCSIRIPRHVQHKGFGYFEDRRPGANADPYIVSTLLIKNTLGM
jgi:glutamine synthetase